jgi:pimeloyl-ACP methyl ester carboxylesterase
MPLISILRTLFGLLSIIILVAAGYLLWSWYQGYVIVDASGAGHLYRDDWRLWTGLGLMAWSFVGRFVAPALLAKPDIVPSIPERSNGRMVQGAGGSDLYVEIHGSDDASPLILTHGWGLDSTIWSYAKAELSKRFRVIVWDLPGLGRSRLNGNAVSLEHFAANLERVIALAGAPAVLVGHSIGGMTIQTLARDFPKVIDRDVAGIVLLNTTYTNPLRTMILSKLLQALRRPVLEPMMRLTIWLQPLAWLSAWQSYLSGSAHMANRLGFGKYVTRSQLEHTTLLATRNPPGVQAKGNLAMFRWDATPALPLISVPVLVLGGDMDLVTKLEASEVIEGAILRATLQVVHGVNHMGFLERADIYHSAIEAFVRRVLPSEGAGATGCHFRP